MALVIGRDALSLSQILTTSVPRLILALFISGSERKRLSPMVAQFRARIVGISWRDLAITLGPILLLSLAGIWFAVEAATGLEALKQARARPDLMDLSMPVVTGDEAMAWLKADPLTRNIPVIVTTDFLSGTLVVPLPSALSEYCISLSI
jgi:CheY-like chemotaxis protein